MGNAFAALLYLRIYSLRNAVISRLRRLKQPKYAIGGVVGMAYVYFAFFRRLRAHRGVNSSGFADAFPAEYLPMVITVAALMLMLFIALCWLLPRARASLAFSESEIAFLFPAPISRQTLIQYRLVILQGGILFTSLIVAVISSGWSFLLGNAWIRVLGWWLILATTWLHVIGSSFVTTQLLDRGVTSLRRQFAALLLFVAIIAAAAVWIWREWQPPQSNDLVDITAILSYCSQQLGSGPFTWLLLPAKWVVRPIVATDAQSFLIALGPALAVYALHYWWVVRSEVSFEEASISRAEKRAARVAAMRAGKVRFGDGTQKARRAPFELSRAKRPELAFFWKNLLSSAEYLRLHTALIFAVIIVSFAQWVTRGGHQAIGNIVGLMALGISAYVLFLGPLIARQDLRQDLLNADILKTYPLRGWQIVLGEILTPVVIVTIILWLMILASTLTLSSFEIKKVPWLTASLRLWVAVGIALLVPLLCTIQVLVMNAAAVLFPAWMQTGQGRSSGIDVMGQRIFFFAGLLIVIGLALLPATIIAGIVCFAAQWIIGIELAVGLGVIVLLGILCVEIGVGIHWIGQRFENFDLSAELHA